MTDGRLFDVPPIERELGRRQRLALELLTARGMLTADELGFELHANRHGAECSCQHGSACPWAERDGRSVLRSLSGRKLVRKDADGWRLRTTPDPSKPGPGDEIPF